VRQPPSYQRKSNVKDCRHGFAMVIRACARWATKLICAAKMRVVAMRVLRIAIINVLVMLVGLDRCFAQFQAPPRPPLYYNLPRQYGAPQYQTYAPPQYQPQYAVPQYQPQYPAPQYQNSPQQYQAQPQFNNRCVTDLGPCAVNMAPLGSPCGCVTQEGQPVSGIID
jgi:hypothetical protein